MFSHSPRRIPNRPTTLLSVHHANFQSAEDEPEIVQELINKEVDSGWVTPFEQFVESIHKAAYPKKHPCQQQRTWSEHIHSGIPIVDSLVYPSMSRVLINKWLYILAIGVCCVSGSKVEFTFIKYAPLVQ